MKKPKVLTFYLPQFHQVKENDEWWGEGFTEWKAVRTSEPLYPGHNQPLVPLNNNYYDLLNKEVMIWQAKLMKEFKIDGMCFYHYYFENGKKLLEKPAENLLIWKDIDMPFCFCWANESWSRAWDRLSSGNKWTSKYEKKREKGDKDILVCQKYGREDQWLRHFEYLLPFFLDERYIKIDNKPVFMMYRTSHCYSFFDMKIFIEKKAMEAGFAGIYWIESKMNEVDAYLKEENVCLYRQPTLAIDVIDKRRVEKKRPFILEYDEFEQVLIETCAKMDEQDLLCVPTGFDNTSRYGKNSTVIHSFTSQKFSKLFEFCYNLACSREHDFIFINAWNEWGEGMVLEPTQKDGYAFLEGVKNAVAVKHDSYLIANNDCTNYFNFCIKHKHSVENQDESLYKYKNSISNLSRRLRLYENWKKINSINVSVGDYLINNGFRHIAIYGAGDICSYILAEVNDLNICVDYLIDKTGVCYCSDLKVYLPDDNLPKVDAVIVTPFSSYASIYRTIRDKVSCPILSIEELVYEMIP